MSALGKDQMSLLQRERAMGLTVPNGAVVKRERTHGNPETLIDNRGHTFLREPILQPCWAHRDPDKHYDFKSRTHRSPRPDHWQDVERDPRDNHRPLYTKFGNGREWVADELCGVSESSTIEALRTP